MKKQSTLLFFLFLPVFLFPYTWIPYGPQGVEVTNVCFAVNSSYGVICCPEGMYIYEDDMEWHFYTYGLPVIEAVHYNLEKILLIMGDGTYSDGIYTFDLQTKEFEVVEWYFKPSFLRYNPFDNAYYLGQEEGGLNISSDGTTWYNISYFDEMPCLDIEFYEENIAVAVTTDPYDLVQCSGNGGTTWIPSTNGADIELLAKDSFGKFFGVKPSAGNSSGVYFSGDYGDFWDAMNWEWQINALECDAIGNVFVGWNNGWGVAMLDPNVIYPEFIYLNEGLPDTHVNNIKVNPTMSAIAIFVCTNSGVFMSYDYMVDIPENKPDISIKVFPNPVEKDRQFTISVPDKCIGSEIVIQNSTGEKVADLILRSNLCNLKLPGIQSGLYYLTIRSGNQIHSTKKLLVR